MKQALWFIERPCLDEIDCVWVTVLYVWGWSGGKLHFVMSTALREDWEDAHPSEAQLTKFVLAQNWRRIHANATPTHRYSIVRVSPTRGTGQKRWFGNRARSEGSMDSSV